MRVCRVCCLAAVAAFVLSIFGFAVVLHGWPGGNFWSTTTAAWVQAIGSIGAIFGSFYLGERSYKRDRKERSQRELATKQEAVNRVLAANSLADERVRMLSLQMKADPPVIQKERLSDVRDCVDVMNEALMGIQHLPGTWAAGKQLTQILRKVFDLTDDAYSANDEGKSDTVTKALTQSNVFLNATGAYEQVLRAEINAVAILINRRDSGLSSARD